MKKNKWIKLLNRKSSLAFSAALIFSNKYILKKKLNISIDNFWEDSITNNICYIAEELDDLGKMINSKIVKEPWFIKKNIIDCKRSSTRLLKIAKNLSKIKSSTLSNRQIATSLSSFNKYYQEFMYYVTFPHAIETFINTELINALSKYTTPEEAEVISKIFILPKTLDNRQQIDIFNAVLKVKQDPDLLIKESKYLQRQYGWLPMWSLTAKPLSSEFYQEQILSLIKDDLDYKKIITEVKNEQKINNQVFNKAIIKIKGDRIIENYIDLIQEYVHLRVLRKDTISLSHFYLSQLLAEVEKRFGVKDIVYYMSNDEIIKALLDKNADLRQFKNRIKGYGIYSIGGELKVITGKKNILNNLYKLVPSIKNEINLSNIKELRGTIASQGKASGRAVIVNSIIEINKVKKGDVLITPMTTPDYTSALNKVVAIITNEGGVTCHAAIISREFNIPCIISTKIATSVFQDGDKVEVDANNGICRKIS